MQQHNRMEKFFEDDSTAQIAEPANGEITKLLALLERRGYKIESVAPSLHQNTGYLDQFNVSIRRVDDRGTRFMGWLYLTCIHGLIWSDPRSNLRAFRASIEMSDYPMMDGDWSGIRDSSPSTIREIFSRLILPMIRQ